MDSSTEKLERELRIRLKSKCSPNELFAYLTVLLFYSGFTKDYVPFTLENMSIISQFLRQWGSDDKVYKLSLMGRVIITKIQSLDKTTKVKMSSILDHAVALSSVIDDELPCHRISIEPSEN